MILIFGGAFQGKLDYAKEMYNVNTVFDCDACLTEDAELDFACDAIYSIDKFVLKCVDDGAEAAEIFKEHKEEWQDKILIMTDISQGIVPMEARLRALREMNGRLMLYLSREADKVIRVFCGLGKEVK